jgi:hypothetical protein
MADENKELMELLEKLKRMQPEGTKGEEKASKPAAKEERSAEEIVSRAAERKPVARPAKKTQVLTGEIYKKIVELQKDIGSREDGIKVDLQKLDALVEALSDREAELAEKESAVAKKDQELTRQLDDLRRIKKELQGVLK